MARGGQFVDGHYASISREHRKAIEDATKLLGSTDCHRRDHALRVLVTIYEHDKVCMYHKAKICGVLADLGSQDIEDVQPWATKCVDLCREIIEVEHLADGSCARQPFDDMIFNAKAILRDIEEGEKEVIEERKEGDIEMEFDEDEERGDEIVDDEEDDEEVDMEEDIDTDDAADEFEEGLLQGLSDFEQANNNSNALASRITRDPNYVQSEDTDLELEVEVTVDQAHLISKIIHMVKQDLHMMDWVIQQAAAAHPGFFQDLEPPQQLQFDKLSIRVRPQDEQTQEGDASGAGEL